MEYRKLGNTGIQISALSFGSWLTFGKQIDDKTSEALLGMAYDSGMNFFDNAEIYARGHRDVVMGTAHTWFPARCFSDSRRTNPTNGV
jgi:aryl-alcohol dehydrogenase-like predicted oxidoreductase